MISTFTGGALSTISSSYLFCMTLDGVTITIRHTFVVKIFWGGTTIGLHRSEYI